jgi:tetratricopeptide (TPR) repeat protein
VGYASLVADAALAQAELADRTGASEEAGGHYDEAVAIAREIGAPHEIARALTAYGSFLARAGREADADAALTEAVTRAREAGTAVSIVLSSCQRAALGGWDPGPAAAALAEHGPRLEHADRMQAHFLLWQATGEGEHLREARRLLDHSLASAPSAWHASMRTQVPLHRAILADSERSASRPLKPGS